MNHRRHWNNEPYITYIAWINTITLGGKRHKVQAVVQEVSAATVWKGVWKSAYGLFPLFTATPSSVRIWHLICWKGQPARAVTSSVQQDIAPHLQLELHRESIHKTLPELAVSWQLDTISIWPCLPFNTVMSSLPFIPVVSQLMDKWQHTTVELVLPRFFPFF